MVIVIMLSVIMPSVIMVNAVAPISCASLDNLIDWDSQTVKEE
jgi:hypothetical protein